MKIRASQIRQIIREELENYMMDGGYAHRGIGYMEDDQYMEDDEGGGHYGMMEDDENMYEEDEGMYEADEDDENMYEEDEGYETDMYEQHDNDQKRMNQPGGDETHYMKHRIKAELTEALRRRR
jgi:hypothetical protein